MIGGDGRYYNREVIQIAIAHGRRQRFRQGHRRAGRHPVDAGRLARHPQIQGLRRLILSASHNPGGPHEDFGIKYNIGNGGPAPEKITDAIFERTKMIASYKIADIEPIDIDKVGTRQGRRHDASRSSIRSPTMPS